MLEIDGAPPACARALSSQHRVRLYIATEESVLDRLAAHIPSTKTCEAGGSRPVSLHEAHMSKGITVGGCSRRDTWD